MSAARRHCEETPLTCVPAESTRGWLGMRRQLSAGGCRKLLRGFAWQWLDLVSRA